MGHTGQRTSKTAARHSLACGGALYAVLRNLKLVVLLSYLVLVKLGVKLYQASEFRSRISNQYNSRMAANVRTVVTLR